MQEHVHAETEGAAGAPEIPDRYADLRSWWRTPAAQEFIHRIYADIEQLEQKTGSRVRRRQARHGRSFTDALIRFVGDLLRAPGSIYRPTGEDGFRDAPVKRDTFMRVLNGLKGHGLVEHRKGRSSSRDTGFGFRMTVPGQAARFQATPKLLQLAAEHDINRNNVNEHFRPELPSRPLVLRDYGTGRGSNKERGRIIKNYRRTPETERLERDVKDLNEFLARFTLTGGRHEAYQRTYNNNAWDKGGRLSSIGEGNYQQLSEAERLRMKIDGKPVAEIDITASHLTIFHAMVGMPLDGRGDPYAQVGIAKDLDELRDRLTMVNALGLGDPFARLGITRGIAKRWVLETLGSGRPKAKWSADAIKEWRKRGEKLPTARAVADAMLDAFPALKKLQEHPRMDLWADLQFKEAKAVLNTMLVLMERGWPSYSMHDGLIVERSRMVLGLAMNTLKQEFRKAVGVEPILTVDPEPDIDHHNYGL
jgi:hypothetical protein